jgi:hypothetical protein
MTLDVFIRGEYNCDHITCQVNQAQKPDIFDKAAALTA